MTKLEGPRPEPCTILALMVQRGEIGVHFGFLFASQFSKVGGDRPNRFESWGDASHGSHRVVAPMGFGIEKYLLIIVVNPFERERTRVPKARIKFNYYRK